MPATLWSIRYSPWSVRVRWALGVLKYDFTVLSYASVFLREWRLRLLMRKWNVTVPVLVDKKVRIMGGKEILEHVQEQMGAGPKLIRQGVDDWLQIAEEVMENERARGLQIALSDNEALKGLVPPAMQWQWLFKLGPIGMALIRGKIRALARKYPKKYNEEEMKTALAKIRSGIQASSNIACVTAIETVKGTPGKHVIRFFPPHEGLDYPLDDLLAWRDKIHEQHWVEGI